MKITKLGDNEVKVIKTKKIKDTKGKQVEIDAEPIYYGQKKIDGERAAIQAQISMFSDPDEIAKQLSSLQARLSDLDLIEQELNS